MTEHPGRIETTVLEGITNVELWYPIGTELDLADGKVTFRFDKCRHVALTVIGEQLVVIPAKSDEVPESKQASYVPRHRTH